jgi:hypothetical protein
MVSQFEKLYFNLLKDIREAVFSPNPYKNDIMLGDIYANARRPAQKVADKYTQLTKGLERKE